MEKQRFIFDIDGTLLESDYSYEKEYFRSVLSREDAKQFLPLIGKLIAEYEQKHMRYDISLLSKYLTYESGVLISKEMINGWQKALSEATPIVMDGVVEDLEDLKHRDKSLAILTRWFLKPQVIWLEKSNLKGYFDDFYGGDSFIKPRSSRLYRCLWEISCGSVYNDWRFSRSRYLWSNGNRIRFYLL